MSDQESRNPNLNLETWSLNEWRRHPNPPPFDLKQENFSMAWTSSTEGTIEFRLVSGEVHAIRFAFQDLKFTGELLKNGRPFPFSFIITHRPGSRRQMQGDFFSTDGPGGPDPVASWGAEERGGGPVLGHGRHERGARQPEPAMQR